MNVLIPHQTGLNLYVSELGRGYQDVGYNVIYGPDNLLCRNVTPDILHLQWPEEGYRWRGEGSTQERADHFLDGLRTLRQRGSRLVWTVHNITPHEFMDSKIDEFVYQSVIDMADLIVHHCPCSVDLLASHYKVPADTRSIVVPHGHYLGYENSSTRDEARELLGIPQDAFVYLHFGQVRSYKGLDLLFRAFEDVSVTNKYLLVAGQYSAMRGEGSLRDRLQIAFKRRFSKNIKLALANIPSSNVHLYFNACDCVVLSHSRGLNSGVSVLGMTFGKLVVGPRVGCIEWVLNQGNNLTFEAGNTRALTKALQDAPGVVKAASRAVNLEVATRWGWNDFAVAVGRTLALAGGSESGRSARVS